MNFLGVIIQSVVQIIILVVIVDSLISFFLPPYHPVRETLDRLVNPMLNPIRKLMPSTGGIDFSPLILIVVLELAATLISNILR